MAEETFKHIVWMILVMLTFLGVVYVLLVQIGVINESNSVFDVGEKEVSVNDADRPIDSNVKPTTIEEWLNKLSSEIKCSSYYNELVVQMKSQHPLYDYTDIDNCFILKGVMQ